MAYDVSAVLGAFGLSPEIVKTNLAAIAEPTSANIAEVTKVYAQNGLAPPGQFMAFLLAENEKRYPHDTVRGALTPYLIGGAALLFLLFRRK